MTLFRNKASLLGLANGAALTPANSGGGGQDAFDAVTLSGGASVTYESATESMVCSDAAGGGVARPEWTSKFNTDVLVVEVKLHDRPSSLGGGDSGTIDIRTGSASIARVEIDDATGRLYVYASSGGSIDDSGATVVPSGAGSRVSLAVQVSTGTVKARLFTADDGESSTPAWSTSLSGQALGAANATQVRVGQNNTTPAGVVRIEHVRADDTTMDTLGAWSSTGATAVMTAAARMPAPSALTGTSVTGGGPMTATAVMLAPVLPSAVAGLAVEVLPVPAGAAPQVGVTVTGLHPLTPSLVTVVRSTDGLRWQPVRGLKARRAVSSLFERDYEAPLNVPTTYRLQVDGPSVQGDVEAILTVPSATAWVQDPLNPRTAVPVSTDFPAGVGALRATGATATFDQVVDLVTPAGSDLPVASVGQRRRASRVPLVLDCDPSDSPTLQRLLMESGEVVIRGLPSWVPLDDVATVVLDAVTVAVVGLQRHRWSGEATRVATSSLRLAVPWLSWRDLMDDWPGATWADLMAARPGATFLDWMRDPEG